MVLCTISMYIINNNRTRFNIHHRNIAYNKVTSKTSQPTVPVTRSITNIRPDYSNWSCTENCGGCGIGCRTRTCLTTPFDCIDATLEFNNQSYNQHPCSFGKRTCCTNYRLG